MDFFEQYTPFALQIQEETGVPAALILAQAALESNYGKSAPGNNFFGVKGTGPAGGQRLWTTEVVNGKPVKVQATFRKYISPADSFRDHARLISTSPYYRGVMQAAKSGDINKIAQAIGDSPYATDPQYGQKILNLMKKNNLSNLVPSQTATDKILESVREVVPTAGIVKPVMAAEPVPAVTPSSQRLNVGVYKQPTQPQQVQQTYTTKYGDTPGEIAQKYLGDWNRWKEIWSGDARKMPTGITLKIPSSGGSVSQPQPTPVPTPAQITSGGQSTRSVFGAPTTSYVNNYRPTPVSTPTRVSTPSFIANSIMGAQSARDVFGRPTTIYK